MKDEALENNIVSLHSRGWSIRRLSREFGVSRERVKRIVACNIKERQNEKPPLATPVKRGSKLDPYKEYLGELLNTYQDPPITNQRVFELLQERGYRGGITLVRDHLVQLRGKKTSEPVVCVEQAPGQRASHDWSEYYLDFAVEGNQKVTFFSMILNYSRRQYLEVVEDKSQHTLMRCLINAFIYFDGVPREVKSDNQKACVDRWELGKPVFNRHYLGFATHYRFRPLVIRPGKPKENLKVERPFYYLETNFLNGRTFCDHQDLKEQLVGWLQQRNDERIHRTTGRKPIELYQEELPFLQPLPARQYDTSTIAYRIVNNESAIQWEDYYYLVPSRYMFETCPVRVNDNQITIYSPDCHPVVSYSLAPKGQKERYVGRPSKQAKYRLNVKEVAERLQAFGPVVQEYCLQIKKRKKSYLHHWRHLLSLKVNYHSEDIIKAVQRALNYRVFESSAIENFLKVNAPRKSEHHFPPKTNRDDQ